jgi:MFS family permease
VAAVLLMSVFASAAASPLYRVYQVQFRFSATTLTAVFAVYVLALLVTLLFFGSVSDYLGRLPVIIAAIGFSAARCAVFLAADSVAALFVARFLQGIATGLASGPIGAALIDLQPSGSERASVVTSAFSTLGLALGAVLSSALVEYAPAPTHLIWWALLAVFAASTVAVLAMAEPGSKRPGVLASLRPRIAVPHQARATFARAIPCLVAVWALGGRLRRSLPWIQRSSSDRWRGNHELRFAVDRARLLGRARRPDSVRSRHPHAPSRRPTPPVNPNIAANHGTRPMQVSPVPASPGPN